MFPIGDYPNPRGIHWMTVALIVVNVAVYLLITLPMSAQPVDVADPRVAESSRRSCRTCRPGTNPSAVLAA